MNAATSSRTVPASVHAGRINAMSRSFFKLLDLTEIRTTGERGSEPALQLALLQKAVVMTHQQMRFHLTHRVQHHTHSDQHARAAEKLRDLGRDVHPVLQNH